MTKIEIPHPHTFSRRDLLLRFTGGVVVSGLERKIGWLPEHLPFVTPPPIVMTGFEPFIHGEDWNSSTEIVKYFQEQYQKSKKPIPQMYFLPNLPAKNGDSRSDAKQIEDFVQAECPKGCIVLSLGEDSYMSSYTAARIEHQSRYSPDVGADFPTELLTRWQLSDTLCLRILKYIKDNHQNIFGPNSNLRVQLTVGQDTANGSECEKTLTSLNAYSHEQALLTPTPYPFLPIFIHVPNSDNIQTLTPTINVIRAVARVATLHFEEYSRHPETFIIKFMPGNTEGQNNN